MELCTLSRGILFHVPYFQHRAWCRSRKPRGGFGLGAAAKLPCPRREIGTQR